MGQEVNASVAESTSKDVLLLQAFVAVVAAGSFSKAARRTSVDKSLLSRRVQALEERLGVRLLQRTTRRCHVTEVGRSLFDSVSAPLDSIATALVEAARHDGLSGRLRVATIPQLTRDVIGPVVKTMRQQHPRVTVDLRAEEAMIDLVGEGVDVAFRVGRLADSSLVSRKLGEWRYILCASPEWIAAHPEVDEPEDVASEWIMYSDVRQADVWRLNSDERTVELRLNPIASVDESTTLRELVRQGIGVSTLPPFMVADDLERGTLVRLLPAWSVDSTYGIYAVYPHRALVPERVQVFIELMAKRVAAEARRWSALT